ncbi:hypothetical protein U9M48_002790 [Paspalum notatum var. saurae]|uniref:Reverse transcriptase domain-containing protein n=1 Tax=Paspalum notatum var. saurae TaxID=547442 RepID=A0AAQ3PHN6_PASNO
MDLLDQRDFWIRDIINSTQWSSRENLSPQKRSKAKDMNLLKLPIPKLHSKDFPIIQYANDTLIIMEGDARQLIVLKSLLNTFADSVGLKPFTYLGLPLGLTKLRIVEFLPLVKRCEKRLAATTMFLSHAGHLELVKQILLTQRPCQTRDSLHLQASFAMSTFYLHKDLVKQIDAYIRQCLWRGADMDDQKPPKIAWTKVTKRYFHPPKAEEKDPNKPTTKTGAADILQKPDLRVVGRRCFLSLVPH